MLSDTRKNRTLSTCLVVGMLVLIWGNSLLTADISSAISRFVGTLLGGGRQMAESSQGHHLLRKLGHFLEFTALGFSLTWRLNLGKRNLSLPLLLGLLAACVDETIQRYIPGRSGQVSDVWVDFSGLLLGWCLFRLITRLRKH